MESSILFIFILSACVLLFYWLRYFIKISNVEQNKVDGDIKNPLSIIIAAKNEAANIQNCLSSILNQEYPIFEIIVVDDHSEDNTKDLILKEYSDKVKLLSNPIGKKGKKQAITFGISNAKYRHFVFTDADCVPSSSKWLSAINSSFINGNNIVLGHGRFNKANDLLNRIIRYESVLNVIQYFSYALDSNPYMGVGRNMAYTKELYESSTKVNGYDNIFSGDDDLFVNHNSDKLKAGVLMAKNAQTFSDPENNFKSYFHQKRRQLTAGNHYKSKHRVMLAIYGASQFIFTSLFFVLLFSDQFRLIAIGVLVLKELIQMYLFNGFCKKLGDKDLVLWKPFLEGLYIYTITLIGISTWVRKVDRWK